MFRICFEIQVDGRMPSEGDEGSKISADSPQGFIFSGRESRIDVDIQVRILHCTHWKFWVAFGPS